MTRDRERDKQTTKAELTSRPDPPTRKGTNSSTLYPGALGPSPKTGAHLEVGWPSPAPRGTLLMTALLGAPPSQGSPKPAKGPKSAGVAGERARQRRTRSPDPGWGGRPTADPGGRLGATLGGRKGGERGGYESREPVEAARLGAPWLDGRGRHGKLGACIFKGGLNPRPPRLFSGNIRSAVNHPVRRETEALSSMTLLDRNQEAVDVGRGPVRCAFLSQTY